VAGNDGAKLLERGGEVFDGAPPFVGIAVKNPRQLAVRAVPITAGFLGAADQPAVAALIDVTPSVDARRATIADGHPISGINELMQWQPPTSF
jgi:hypothetical protein